MPESAKEGKLLGIAIKEGPQAPMRLIATTNITPQSGIEDERRTHSLHRQITIISRESWEEACAVIQNSLPWTIRRANLLIEGLDLQETVGNFLRIGDLILKVTGETRPCRRMEEAHQGLQVALAPNWRGGVTCSVVRGGRITLGDRIQVTDPPT